MQAEIDYAPLGRFRLDPRNPRLGMWRPDDPVLPQEKIYERMSDWTLHELATSFLESGFWVHEAVLCVHEDLDGEEALVVVEGNRRIAALMRLQRTYDGEDQSKTWLELIDDKSRPEELFTRVPYMTLSTREEADAFLGFRHVTGIKEWRPPEKARFIAKLIESGMSYRQVMRKIGSQTEVVRRNYIAHCIFEQMEQTQDLDAERVRERFSVLFLSLRAPAVQQFLGIEEKFEVDPREVVPVIDPTHMGNLKDYTLWLFGDQDNLPVVTDSRQVDRFAKVLDSEAALDYMRKVDYPDLERAFSIAGGDIEVIYDLVSSAVLRLREALSTLYLHRGNPKLKAMAGQLIEATEEIAKTLEIRER